MLRFLWTTIMAIRQCNHAQRKGFLQSANGGTVAAQEVRRVSKPKFPKLAFRDFPWPGEGGVSAKSNSLVIANVECKTQ